LKLNLNDDLTTFETARGPTATVETSPQYLIIGVFPKAPNDKDVPHKAPENNFQNLQHDCTLFNTIAVIALQYLNVGCFIPPNGKNRKESDQHAATQRIVYHSPNSPYSSRAVKLTQLGLGSSFSDLFPPIGKPKCFSPSYITMHYLFFSKLNDIFLVGAHYASVIILPLHT